MRKIFLAGAAMLATTGVAFAQPTTPPTTPTASTSITLQTIVPKTCTVAFADGSNLTVPADGTESAGKTVNLSCNFAGETADLTFTSTNLGVKDSSPGASLTAAQVYTIKYGQGTATPASIGTSATGGQATNVASTVGTTTGVFTAQLVNPITTAGTFSDTVSVTVSPL